MNTSSLLQQTLEQLDFNQLQPLDNLLKNAFQKINQGIKPSSPHLLQTLLHQTFTQLNYSSESTPILETALEILNRGIIGKEIPLDDHLVDEELPTLPDLDEDILATETRPLESLFVLAKSEYKEPRSFVLEKATTDTETEPAVISINPIKQLIKTQSPIATLPLIVRQPISSETGQANHFFASLPYEKALPRIKVIEQDTGEETHFHILPGKQNTWKTDGNTTENPLFAATLQAIQTSGGKMPTQLSKNDYNMKKSRAFFSALPW